MATLELEKKTKTSAETQEASGDGARLEKTIGFPKSDTETSRTLQPGGQTRPAASLRTRKVTPKRPKGRWFITLFICAIVLVIGNKIWTQFGQNRAYGLIQGRVLEIRAPWNGTIESIHVRDGQQVDQGQLLATINNFEFRNERLRLKHELEIALADLAMRVADIQSQEQAQSNSSSRLQVEYYQLLGRLHSERARLEELAASYKTNQWLFNQDSFPKVELESNRIQLEGQTAVVADLSEALTRLQNRLEQTDERDDSILKPLRLQQARIKSIESEFQRLGQLECLGEIRAPVQGRVVRRSQFTGEFIEKKSVLFEVLEQDSLEAVLYLPQSHTELVHTGDEINLVLSPDSQTKTFVVTRFGEQMVPAPESIERFYNSKQRLVPIHAAPKPGQASQANESDNWILGAEVRLPRFGFRSDANTSQSSGLAQLKQVFGL